jgi:hypothetical protein
MTAGSGSGFDFVKILKPSVRLCIGGGPTKVIRSSQSCILAVEKTHLEQKFERIKISSPYFSLVVSLLSSFILILCHRTGAGKKKNCGPLFNDAGAASSGHEALAPIGHRDACRV